MKGETGRWANRLAAAALLGCLLLVLWAAASAPRHFRWGGALERVGTVEGRVFCGDCRRQVRGRWPVHRDEAGRLLLPAPLHHCADAPR